MKRVLAIILGGGAGTRLQPLTLTRAKPAVPLGGNYRLIDIPISNCINSGISQIYALTQFNSQSLNRHISLTYNLSSSFNGGFVEVLAAQQTPDSPSWFEGTADAVRQYRELFEAWDVDQLLILSGDQLYRMDYEAFIAAHRASGAALTVGALPVDAATAQGFGLMRTDADGRIQEFREKPRGEALEAMRVDTGALGLSAAEAQRRPFLASMGIYVFERETLFDLLQRHPEATDFGKDIIPTALGSGLRLQSHLFDGYWEDIGTIKAFYEATWPSPMISRRSASMQRLLRSTPARAICRPARFTMPGFAARSSAKAAGWIAASSITACLVSACGLRRASS